MHREARREQILATATGAFAQLGGFAPTSLDDVARAAGITRMILYRHFDSKADLYQAVLERAANQLYSAATGDDGIGEHSIPGMLRWAAGDPDAFRLLFHHAARETEHRDEIDELRANMVAALEQQANLATAGQVWASWGANLAVTVVIEGIMAWLDAGQPDPDQATERIMLAVDGVFEAIGHSP
ncbi:TetR family transcriptional regulator [Tamaricihabitans halophyticus]|uniref:TetR family transcriptional regulator n=1 Tax=Tamaricihabitans halophyticus TaxID=1262583 RepID=A0A4V2SU75_9PSEU|nr:TetR family transcriptional regulator [Tamaricihabitans halophyticus]